MNRILFLDIDGVLNSTRSSIAAKMEYLPSPHVLSGPPDVPRQFNDTDWVAVGMVSNLCTRQDVRIVLSSSWREIFKTDYLADLFTLPILDATDTGPGIRGEQIQRWLDAHPEVTTYAIVDDCSQMLASQEPYFVKTDFDEGLTYEKYKELKNIFEGKPKGSPRSLNILLWEE